MVARIRETILLAVDPSLTSTGWAAFSIAHGQPLDVGTITSKSSGATLASRLRVLQSEIEALLLKFSVGYGDYVVCEGPAPLVVNPASALKVEHIRGIFETLARSRGASVPGRLNPRTVQTELLGMRGRQLGRAHVKAWARETVNRMYGQWLESLLQNDAGFGRRLSQDIVDALLVGTVAAARVSQCLRLGVDVEQAFVSPRKNAGRGRRNVVIWDGYQARKVFDDIS